MDRGELSDSRTENERNLSSPTLDRLMEVIRAQIECFVFHGGPAAVVATSTESQISLYYA